ncbi:MAG: hypothetical protein IPK79_08325 [Vampirovibrionales bacterium]|nr:hypothetical protein [Vampirovibrionales bacterium]
MNKNKEFNCRICGFLSSIPIWEGEHTDYGICPACGCQAGEDDMTLEIVRYYRQKWADSGMKWWGVNEHCPAGWNPHEQMKYIPPNWL